MPRKKRSGVGSAQDKERKTLDGLHVPAGEKAWEGGSGTSTTRGQVVDSMVSMFPDLDPQVVYFVLVECDFSADVAMDSLLELSGAFGPRQQLRTGESNAIAQELMSGGSNWISDHEQSRSATNTGDVVYTVSSTQEVGDEFDYLHPTDSLDTLPSGMQSDAIFSVVPSSIDDMSALNWLQSDPLSSGLEVSFPSSIAQESIIETTASGSTHQSNSKSGNCGPLSNTLEGSCVPCLQQPAENCQVSFSGSYGGIVCSTKENISAERDERIVDDADVDLLMAIKGIEELQHTDESAVIQDSLSNFGALPDCIMDRVPPINSGTRQENENDVETTSSSHGGSTLEASAAAFKPIYNELRESGQSVKLDESIATQWQQNENISTSQWAPTHAWPSFYSTEQIYPMNQYGQPMTWRPGIDWQSKWGGQLLMSNFGPATSTVDSWNHPVFGFTEPSVNMYRMNPMAAPFVFHPNAPMQKQVHPLPKQSWPTQTHPEPRNPSPVNEMRSGFKEVKVLFLLRGLPGSGKSTLARRIKEQGLSGVILSTDDYFIKNGAYCFDPSVLGEAHEWNHKRARDAMDAGMSPVIIDNTNTHGWEMRPYVAMALRKNYKIVFKEPNTPWKFKARELEKRNTHGISREKIICMLGNYERHMTVERVMGSFKATNDHWMGQEDVEEKSEQMLVQTERAALQQAVNHENGSLPCAGRPSKDLKQYSRSNKSSKEAAVMVHKNIDENSDARSTENIPLPDLFPLESGVVAEGFPKMLASDWQAEVTKPDECSVFNKTADHEMKVADNQAIGDSILSSETMKKRITMRHRNSSAIQIPQQTYDLVRNEFDLANDWPSDIPTAPLSQRTRRPRRDFAQNTAVDSQAVSDLTVYLPECEIAAFGRSAVNECLDAEVAQEMSIEKLLKVVEPNHTQIRTEITSCVPADIFRTGSGEGANMVEYDVLSIKCPHNHVTAVLEKNEDRVHGQPGGIISVSCTDKVSTEVEGQITGHSDNVPHVLKASCSSLVAQNTFLAQVMKTIHLKQIEQLALSSDSMEGYHGPKVAVAMSSMPRSSKNDLTAKISQALSLQMVDDGGLKRHDCAVYPSDQRHQSTQTTPEDFALMWKVTKKKLESVNPFVLVYGNPDRFIVCNEAVTAEGNPNIPYKLRLDKGILTENMENPDPERDAEYLVTHFRSVKREVLVDIYEKCNRDLNWTVNVLIESDVEMSEEIIKEETDTETSIFIDKDVLHEIETMECSTSQDAQVLNNVLQSNSSMQPGMLCDTAYFISVNKQPETSHSNMGTDAGSKKDESEIDCCPQKYGVEDALVDLQRDTPPGSVSEINTTVFSDSEHPPIHGELEWTSGTNGQHIDNVQPQEDAVSIENRSSNEAFLDGETKVAACDDGIVKHVNCNSKHVEGETESSADQAEHNVSDYSAKLHGCSSQNKKIISSTNDDIKVSDIHVPHVSERTGTSETVPTLEQLTGQSVIAQADSSNPSALVLEAARTLKTLAMQPIIARGFEIEVGAMPEAPPRKAMEGNIGQMRKVESDDLFHKGSEVGRAAETSAGEGGNAYPFLSTLEFSLSHELAIQLIELFGSVGLDEFSLVPEDLAVRINMKMAQMIHQHWKDSILARQKEEALSYQLLQEDSRSLQLMVEDYQPAERTSFSQNYMSRPSSAPNSAMGRRQQWTALPVSQLLGSSVDEDLWDVTYAPSCRQGQGQPSSLLDIMSEELASQLSREESAGKTVRTKKDVSAKLKEKKLFELFPGIDRQFLMDVYRDHDYSLEFAQQFLSSVLANDTGPARTVVALDVYSAGERQDLQTALQLSLREHALRGTGDIGGTGGTSIPAASSPSQPVADSETPQCDDAAFQDMEAPDYDDFRAEAFTHHQQRRECFQRAAEACHRGMRDVAMHYARQGHLHGEKMKEANVLAGRVILQQQNKTLLPHGILDLHGLHRGEAMAALVEILEQRQRDCQAQGKSSVLSVITGQGNNSRGGVSRLKPAVLDFLRKNKYRFSEPHAGLVKVHLPRAREV